MTPFSFRKGGFYCSEGNYVLIDLETLKNVENNGKSRFILEHDMGITFINKYWRMK